MNPSDANEPPRREGFDVVRFVLAAVLFVAAGLKFEQLLRGTPLTGSGLATSRFAQPVLIDAELFLAAWLLCGAYRGALWFVSLACFSGLGAVALHRAWSGASSCGCFGRVEVNPWWTFALDAASCAALIAFRPRGDATRASVRPVYVRAAAAAWALAAVAVAASAALVKPPQQIESSEDLLGAESLVVLEPERWVGKRFPLEHHIDVGGTLMSGRWTVVFYRYDCSHCRESLPEYERRARSAGADEPHVALISIPPHAPPGEDIVPQDTRCSLGRLDRRRDWFVQTPCEITLRGGVVTACRTADMLPKP